MRVLKGASQVKDPALRTSSVIALLANALYDTVKGMRSRGVPINGVGMQLQSARTRAIQGQTEIGGRAGEHLP